MAHQYRISKEVRERLDALRIEMTNLNVEVEKITDEMTEISNDHLYAFNGTTERYQDSDRGMEVNDWINGLDVLTEELNDLGNALDNLGTTIDNLADKPEG